ncbi:Phage tail tape measure protein [hydrothermal vent metagenome]|uniref:Phage tail tape measure protein n=1 Tax=hydrothermal vent metagenome TaxID=652676 RepID=A0A3B0TNT2_9ZZZZ
MFASNHPMSPAPRKLRAFLKEQLIRPRAIYSLFTLLLASNIALGVSLLMSPEIGQILTRNAGQTQAFEQYQDRILRLRMEVDRLHSRQYVQDGGINLKLQQLIIKQQALSEQYSYIRVLAQKAQSMGITTASAQPNNAAGGKIIATSIGAPPYAGPVAPFNIDTLSRSITGMINDSHAVLSEISQNAKTSTIKIINALKTIGIAPDLPGNTALARGGPFIAANPALAEPSSLEAANQAQLALDRFEQARLALKIAPIHAPLPKMGRISSPFGNRADPFGKARAFHSGIDYPNPKGTAVFSAGQGTILFAGWKTGYGKFIEIDHGNGLVTRYAHLSRLLVTTGQKINAGDLIGKVGSTGRSTGPHLHFEVRKNNVAVNPAPYLRVGERLASFIS